LKYHPFHHLHVALPTETCTRHIQKVTLAQSVYCSGCYRLCAGNSELDVFLSLVSQRRDKRMTGDRRFESVVVLSSKVSTPLAGNSTFTN